VPRAAHSCFSEQAHASHLPRVVTCDKEGVNLSRTQEKQRRRRQQTRPKGRALTGRRSEKEKSEKQSRKKKETEPVSGWDGWLHSLSLFGFSRRTGEHFARELLRSSLRSLFSRFSFENEERSECKSLKGYTLVFMSVSTLDRVCSLLSLNFPELDVHLLLRFSPNSESTLSQLCGENRGLNVTLISSHSKNELYCDVTIGSGMLAVDLCLPIMFPERAFPGPTGTCQHERK